MCVNNISKIMEFYIYVRNRKDQRKDKKKTKRKKGEIRIRESVIIS